MAALLPRLDSWKEIARHLGRDVSTVMRWERERGLPVHRLPGAKRSGVFAFREELDAWRAQHPAWPAEPPGIDKTESSRTVARKPEAIAIAEEVEPQTEGVGRVPRRSLLIATAVLAAAGITLAVTLVSKTDPRPVSSLTIESNEFRARDAQGETLWVHSFDAVLVEAPSGRWVHIGDLDADGQAEIVAVVKIRRTPTSEMVNHILCFSEDGELRWTRVPDTHLRFAGGEYGPPWASEDLLAFESGGERRLAWAIRHYTWWPSILIVLDARGAERGRFVNSGWIRSLGVSEDGRVLMASGISNAHRATFLALLDPDRVAGSSPEPPDSEYACIECGPGGPLHYFVLPRTDVSEHATFPPIYAPAIQTFADGSAQVRVSENGEANPPETIYELSSDYVLQRARFTDWFWDWHRRLRAEGLLSHDERACPIHGGLAVRHWTPIAVWRTIRVPAR